MKPSRSEMPALESLPEIGMRSATSPKPPVATAAGAGVVLRGAGGGGGGRCSIVFGTGAAGGASGTVFTREHPARPTSIAAPIHRRTPSNISCATFFGWAGCPFEPLPAALRKYSEETHGSARRRCDADRKSRRSERPRTPVLRRGGPHRSRGHAPHPHAPARHRG